MNQGRALGASNGQRNVLGVALSCFGVFAMVTGLADMIVGPGLLTANGARLGEAAGDLWLNSQLRFQGAIWFGWGVALIWTGRDLHGRGTYLQILLGALFLGGVVRLIAAIPYPKWPSLLIFLIALELIVPMAALVAHRRLVRRSEANAAS